MILMLLCFRRSGAAVTLITRENWRMAPELIPILERAGQVRNLQENNNVTVLNHKQSVHDVLDVVAAAEG